MKRIQKNKLILLVNLGSPERLEVKSIRAFLREFLTDSRVVGLPKFIWYPILFGIILPLRSKKLLAKYKEIWLDQVNSSPLVHYTKRQAELLAEKVNNQDIHIDYAFCYGLRNISTVLAKLEQNYLFNELVVLPLYPQYSSSTTAPVFDQITNYYAKKYFIPKINFINSFAAHKSYIDAIVESIKEFWQLNGVGDKLLISFHSIPVSLVKNGDTYVAECEMTRELIAECLAIDKQNILIAYQSKFGKAEWVTPATDAVISGLAKQGVPRLDVVCPGFVSDCLETLEEVAIQYKELFKSCGGTDLRYISCLNDDEKFISCLADVVELSGD